MHPEYFEAIIQLRNCPDEAIIMIRHLAEQKMHHMISKEKLVKGGVDFYIKKKSFLRFISNRVQERFGGNVVFSNKLHGVDKMSSKLRYRETVLIEIPPVLKGEIVSMDDRVYDISSVNKTKATLVDMITGKVIFADYTKLKLVLIKERYKSQVTKVHPHLEVLHPLTYDSVPVKNPKKLPLGKNVRVFVFNDEVYLV